MTEERMRKARILGIAPYEGLRTLMEQIAGKRNDMEFTSIYANLDDGQKIARTIGHDFDVIISRARTANMIYEETYLPVVDIGIGYYDVLRSIRQARNSGRKFAIIGFHALVRIAEPICQLMKYEIPIIAMKKAEDIRPALEGLLEKGIDIIICDTQPYDIAKAMGITPLLLTNSADSVSDAFERAMQIFRSNYNQNYRLGIYGKIIDSSEELSLVMDMEKNLLYPYSPAPEQQPLIALLRERFSEISGNSQFFINVKGINYAVSTHYFDDFYRPYLIFHIRRTSIPSYCSKNGITIINRSQAEQNANDGFYRLSPQSRQLAATIEKLNQSSESCMIIGEVGTSKDRIAQDIYQQSRLSKHPMYLMDFSLINDRFWSFITTNYNSPFTDNGNTLYLSNLNALSEMRQNQLLSIIADTNLHSRNRLLFSCIPNEDGTVPHFVMRFCNLTGCNMLRLPAMREHPEDIITSAVLYLNTLNKDLSRQVVGMDDDAAELLKAYHWPYNRTQFKRVLREIVILTDAPYISSDTVRSVLSGEESFHSVHEHLKPNETKKEVPAISAETSSENSLSLDTSGTLEDMNRQIILHVLEQCGGNRTQAAKRLAISRTSLWRYLSA